jgi:hypothetical protein
MSLALLSDYCARLYLLDETLAEYSSPLSQKGKSQVGLKVALLAALLHQENSTKSVA